MTADTPPAKTGLVHELEDLLTATSAALETTRTQSVDIQNLLAVYGEVSPEFFHECRKRVAEGTLDYACKVADLCSFGHNKVRIERLRKEIQHGDSREELKDFVTQLGVFRTDCQLCYKNLSAALADLRSKAFRVVRTCKDHEQKTKLRKNSVRAVGWTVAIGLLLVGVTVGIGGAAKIGLLTCIAAMCCAVVVHCIVSHLATSEEEFKKFGQSFYAEYASASHRDAALIGTKVYLDNILGILNYIQTTSESRNARLSLTLALDRLCHKFDGDDQGYFTLQRNLLTTFLNLPMQKTLL